ncbi:MAG: BrxA/BrxB family bacilliredoxin [Bacteroidetes bacterium]|nr:BrxA/BrxB family bacilliredoxin [Bacteroidota bacterium]
MPYPEALVQPMRQELTRLGVEELKTAEAVDTAFADAEDASMLLVINSVCGCAAANARPAVAMAKQADVPQPDRHVTVFAGQDLEATERAREYLAGIPPSSPFIALLNEGDPVFVLERRHIEGRSASAIASDLVQAYQSLADGTAADDGAPARPDAAQEPESDNGLPSTFRSIM